MTLPALKRIAALRALFLADDFDAIMAQAEDPAVVARFASELRALDKALTDKVYTHTGAYTTDAQRILEGQTVVLHLADGGYSRLGIGFVESAVPWMDEGVSLPEAIARWRAIKGGQRTKRTAMRGRRTTARKPACKIVYADPEGYGDDDFDYDAVDRLFQQSGVRIASYEEAFSQCVDRQGRVAGVTVLGLTDDEMRFSVAVHPKARRQGIARMLILSIMEHYVGQRDELQEAYGKWYTLHAWVINPHMALLLEDLGFDGDWSPSDAMMQWRGDAADIPGSAAWKRRKAKRAKAEAARKAQYAADAPKRAAKAAQERATFDAQEAAETAQWRKAGVKAREAKAAALKKTPSPIRGTSAWDSVFGRRWRKKLNVDKTGKALPYGQTAKRNRFGRRRR